MNSLETLLYRTRKTIRETCKENILDYSGTEDITQIAQCYSCSIWLYHKELKEDEDGSEVCANCLTYYGH